MPRPEAFCKCLNNLMIRAAFAGRVDQFGADLDMAMGAGLIDVVMLHEHRRGQHQIGHGGGFGHELLMHAHEQILTRETAPDAVGIGGDGHGICVLNQHAMDLRAIA